MNTLARDNRANSTDLGYTVTVTQVNEVKDYAHGRKFFCRLIDLATQQEYLSMFAEAHHGKFSVGDVIAFDAKMRHGKKPGEVWLTIPPDVTVRNLGAGRIEEIVETLDVKYVSYPKVRNGDGGSGKDKESSFCLIGDEWSLELPVSVMKAYFEPGKSSSASAFKFTGKPVGPGLYNFLCVPQDATEQELKKAYRRMARKWHPDVSDAPDATARFQELQRAYDILKDPAKRQRHDVLVHETAESDAKLGFTYVEASFVPPFRCGRLTVRAKKLGSKLEAVEIRKWLVHRRTQVLQIPFVECEFLADGIMVNYAMHTGLDIGSRPMRRSDVFVVEIENCDLPFVSERRLNHSVNKKHLIGMLSLKARQVQTAKWQSVPGAVGFSGSPVSYWDVEEVLGVSLDGMALNNLRERKAKVR